MDKKVNIAIIGAGTAGISAYKEASKYTNDILLIDKGPIGSTCARIGCMPSKQLIHVANQYYQCRYFNKIGIKHADKLKINMSEALAHVRAMRDKFTAGVIQYIESLEENFLCGEAKFVDSNTLEIDGKRVIADNIIIATGSSSFIPESWPINVSDILTSETVFEQEYFPTEIAVIGGGIIGLELGQALSRLGINLSLYHAGSFIGGLTDPKVNACAIGTLGNEFPLKLNEKVSIDKSSNDKFIIKTSSERCSVDAILAAIGRTPNLNNLGLENLDIEMNEDGIPRYDATTMKISNLPIYIVGDANKVRPLLHEAADEGRIAGFNAASTSDTKQCFKRRIPLRILFSQPNIAIIGQSYKSLKGKSFVIGEASFQDQGRAKIENRNQGILRVYGDKKSGKLLGAECIAPAGEHLAHLLAWSIQKEMSVFEILQMPFYHPVIEEGFRTAMRDLAKQVEAKSKSFELAMCDSEAIHSLS